MKSLVGFGVALAVDQLVGPEQQAVGVVRVDLERGVERLFGPGAISVGQGAGQQVVKPRVVAGFLGRFAERLGRQGEILFIECQLGRREMGVDEVRLLLGDHIVELIEHLLGIGPADQEEAPERDQSRGRGITARPALE